VCLFVCCVVCVVCVNFVCAQLLGVVGWLVFVLFFVGGVVVRFRFSICCGLVEVSLTFFVGVVIICTRVPV